MQYYVGLDVSLKDTAICVVTATGDIVKEGMVPSDPESIALFLTRLKLTYELVGLEAGGLTPLLYRGLENAGLPVICLETRHVKAALNAQQIKTDRNDARGLAHIVRTGWYRAVHIKSDQNQRLRVLLNNRRQLMETRIALENQIRGTLKIFGYKAGRLSKMQFEDGVLALIAADDELSQAISPVLKARAALQDQERALDSALRRYAKEDSVCKRLMTIPGVGVLTAVAFKTTIDNPARFRRSRDVGPHLGLTPRKYASGEIDYNGRISRCGDGMARTHLYEAAKVILSRVTKWSSLKAWGMNIARRAGMRKACVAVARKLATVMHRIWRDGTEYVWGTPPDGKAVA
ncbi:MAG: IS110 family transposase [Pseudomonadota bacterium]